MGLFKRALRREEPEESPCPRCAVPAPVTARECSACGWDLRESFHGPYAGSSVTASDLERAEAG